MYPAPISARFVTQPDVVIMMNSRCRHADFTLYVDSERVLDLEAAALFWLALQRDASLLNFD